MGILISMPNAIAAVAVKALTEDGYEGQTYTLTGPKAISYHDIASALSETLGREIKYIQVSIDDAHKGTLDSGMPEWLVNDLTELNHVYSAGHASDLSPDVEKITGREPYSIEDFIRDFADKFK